MAVDLEHTLAAGQATDLARRAAGHGYDLVVACGGDGTVSEVANGLAGSGVPMGVLPAGTVNIWATEAGIPRDPVKAARVMLEGQTRAVDLGLAGVRYFLLMAGVGLDGAVARDLRPIMKRSLGRMAYVLTGIWSFAGYKGSPVALVVDGRRLDRHVVWIVVGNTRLYGGVVTVTPRARADDGLLDLCIFSGRGFFSSAGHLLALIRGRHLASAGVEYQHCREVSVESARPLPVQADGDHIGSTPQTFRIAAGALRVVVPRGSDRMIFSGPSRTERAA